MPASLRDGVHRPVPGKLLPFPPSSAPDFSFLSIETSELSECFGSCLRHAQLGNVVRFKIIPATKIESNCISARFHSKRSWQCPEFKALFLPKPLQIHEILKVRSPYSYYFLKGGVQRGSRTKGFGVFPAVPRCCAIAPQPAPARPHRPRFLAPT